MDIQEAIEHARQVAEGCDAQSRDCAYQHYKLADWLEELDAYRATKLTPDDLTATFDEKTFLRLAARVLDTTPERLQELAQADQDGRLVVLPCKVGDTVYRVVSICTWPEAECPDDSHSCSGCRELRFEVVREKIENVGEAFIAVQYWGRTIFATRQEAEAAVEKGADT